MYVKHNATLALQVIPLQRRKMHEECDLEPVGHEDRPRQLHHSGGFEKLEFHAEASITEPQSE
jgi:hypothetical protein